MMRLLRSLLLLSAIQGAHASLQIRGVSPSDQTKYLSSEFECLVAGRPTSLPNARVNDEFCDCDNGEDEPGTAACSHLLTSEFHCENDGFFPTKIHTSRVDDGICDCCDGSDEARGAVKCGNTCSVEAESHRKDAEEKLKLVQAGFEKRQAAINGEIAEYFDGEKQTENSKEKELAALELLKARVIVHKEREELKEKKHRLEVARQRQAEGHSAGQSADDTSRAKFSDAAEKEAVDALDFEGLDAIRVADEDAPVNSHEDERASHVLDSRGTSLKSLIELPDGTRVPLAEYLRMDHNPRPTKKLCARFHILMIMFTNSCVMLDLLSRRAPRTAEQMRREDFLGPLFNGDAEGRKRIGLKALRTIGIIISPLRAIVELVLFAPMTLWDVVSSPELAGGLLNKLPAFPYPSRSTWFRQLGGGSVYEAYGLVTWSMRVTWDAPVYAYHYLFPKLDEEVTLPVANSLRKVLQEIESEIKKLEKERDEKRDAAKADYGPDRAFFALKDKCIEKRIEKYMYKFCAFGEVKQDRTKLGKWEGWAVNEASTSPSGERQVDHTKMNYTNGQKCYKGPNRSVVVHLECGADDEIVSVDEPSTCVYGMTVRSPFACTAQVLAKAQQDVAFWTRKQ